MEQQKRKCKRQAVFLFLLLFGICVLPMSASAGVGDYVADKVDEALGGNDESWNNYKSITTVTDENYKTDGLYPYGIEGTMVAEAAYDCAKAIVCNDVSDNCMKALNGTLFTESKLDEVMKNLFGAVKNIGIALLAVFFLIELLDKSTRPNFGLEEFIRMMIKYFIMKAVFDNGYAIMTAIMGIGDALVGSMSAVSAVNGASDFLNRLGWILYNGNIIMNVVTWLMCIIPYLFFQILQLVIEAIAYGRVIELVIRGGFMPIGCVSMVQDGFTGHGLRYIKKYFGVCLQGVVILGILYVGGQISTSLLSVFASPTSIFDIFSSLLGIVVVALTELMTILKSAQLASEIAGV